MKRISCSLPLLILSSAMLYRLVESRATNIRHVNSHKIHKSRHTGHSLSRDLSPLDEKKALEHSEAVSDAGSCSVPKPQIVHVSDHYPDSTKYYLPHCTLLHRCGKHAGCCGTDKLKCVAAKKERVTLHFFSVRVTKSGIPEEREIEKLTFTNHTKCACVPKSSRKTDL